jgi:hypothetical protein
VLTVITALASRAPGTTRDPDHETRPANGDGGLIERRPATSHYLGLAM